VPKEFYNLQVVLFYNLKVVEFLSLFKGSTVSRLALKI